MTTFVTTMRDSPLWQAWGIEFIATHRSGSRTARVLAFARGLAGYLWVLTTRRPDLVHLHSGKEGSFVRKAILLWLARAARIPVVLHVHAGRFGLFYDRTPPVGRSAIRRTLAAASVVVALGRGWSQSIQEIAPHARLISIPNPVRIIGVGSRAGEGEPVHVVFLGTMCADKGTFALLDAWARLSDDGSGARAHLTLAGNGDVDRVRELVTRRGLTGSVEVRSWLPAAEVDELLGTAHVLTLPSRNEGQPMSVLEAMGRGLCVVATSVGGIPDLVEDGRSAILVPPDDVDALTAGLRTAIVDPDTRHRLGDAALDRARTSFDVDVVWRRFDALYRELASALPHSRGCGCGSDIRSCHGFAVGQRRGGGADG
ncbi:MAG: glycosyltransferase family 4 protein [Pseudonocardia sp.]